jgi:hypothetical protein
VKRPVQIDIIILDYLAHPIRDEFIQF